MSPPRLADDSGPIDEAAMADNTQGACGVDGRSKCLDGHRLSSTTTGDMKKLEMAAANPLGLLWTLSRTDNPVLRGITTRGAAGRRKLRAGLRSGKKRRRILHILSGGRRTAEQAQQGETEPPSPVRTGRSPSRSTGLAAACEVCTETHEVISKRNLPARMETTSTCRADRIRQPS